MQIVWSKSFEKSLKKKIGKYQFEVGILNDGPHKNPREASRPGSGDNIGSFAGGPVRKTSRVKGPLTIAQVAEANRERTGINYLTEPFKKTDSDIVKFADTFLKLVLQGAADMRRAINLLQAIVRNPITRGDYGGNSRKTQAIKGFNRGWIDTGQFFKAIKARVIKGGRGV